MYSKQKILCGIPFFLFLFLQDFCFAKNIESSAKECEKTHTNFCISAQNLHNALIILYKIQQHNFALLQHQNNRLKKTSIKEAKDIQKDDIAVVSYEEYRALRQYMHRFCKTFRRLHTDEIKLLFTLEWHEKAIFQNQDDVARFCNMKY